ncbi:MAG: hypothetical protein KGL39_37165 [Patescibacteria group bacterium]|nr:hypothetical protein [Patescibacteria group bacterium]
MNEHQIPDQVDGAVAAFGRPLNLVNARVVSDAVIEGYKRGIKESQASAHALDVARQEAYLDGIKFGRPKLSLSKIADMIASKRGQSYFRPRWKDVLHQALEALGIEVSE